MTLAVSLPAAVDTPTFHPAFVSNLSGLRGHLELLRDHGMRLRFRRNEPVFSEGEYAAHIYRLASGCVRICRHVCGGRRHIAGFQFTDDIFGLGDFRHFPYAAEAVGPVTVVAYPRALFEHLAEDNPALQTDVMSHFKTMLEHTQRQLLVTSCLSARERVAAFILEMHGIHRLVLGNRVDLPMARREIADYLGLTVETICRGLAALKREGLIAVPNAHQVAVIDAEGLKALVEAR